MRLVALTVAWLGGIWLGPILWSWQVLGCRQPLWPIAAVGLALLPVAWLCRTGMAGKAALLLVVLLCGALRYGSQPLAPCPTPATVSFYNGTDARPAWVTVEGIIDAYPDRRDSQTLYRLQVDKLAYQGREVEAGGAVLLQAAREPVWRYGDRVRATGTLETPPAFADFDYRAYLARQGIYSLSRRPHVQLLAAGQGSSVLQALYDVRTAGARVIERTLPEPAAALAEGILLGIEGSIPADLSQAFKDTGTAHIVVISGSNVALLTGLLMFSLRRWLGSRLAALVTGCAIVSYVLLAGAQPATLRAGIMGALCALAILFGRQGTPLVLLAASVLFMTMLDPRTLWDVGFQLSVLATLGLIMFSPALQARLSGWLNRRLPSGTPVKVAATMADPLVVTLAAQIMTLPLLVFYFGRASLVSPLANLLILPAQPPLLTTGLALLAGGLAWLPLGRCLAALPWLLLAYTSQTVRLLGRLPQASLDLSPWNQELAAGCYLILAVVLGSRWLARARGLPAWLCAALAPRRILPWLGCALLPLVLAAAVAARPDGKLHLYFLPAGDGEGALLVAPDGQSALIWDGRGDSTTLATAARSASSLRRLPDVFLGPSSANPYPMVPHIDPGPLSPGQELRLGQAVVLKRGLSQAGTLWLRYGQFSALLPQGLDQVTQEQLAVAVQTGMKVTVLKAQAPGTNGWPSTNLLAHAAPQLVIWPRDTSYPPGVITQLAQQNVGRTDPENVTEVISDGVYFEVREYSNLTPR